MIDWKLRSKGKFRFGMCDREKSMSTFAYNEQSIPKHNDIMANDQLQRDASIMDE